MRQKALIAFVLAIWGYPYVYAQEEGPELLDGPAQLDPEIHTVFQQSVFGVPPKDAPPDYDEFTDDPWWKHPEDGEEEEPEEESEPESPSTPPSTPPPSSTPTMDNPMYYRIKSWEGLNAKKLGSAKEVFKNKNQSSKNLDYENLYPESFRDVLKPEPFEIAPEEVAQKIFNEISEGAKDTFNLPNAEVCIDATKKMSDLAYGMYKDGYEAYGDEIVYVGKETLKLLPRAHPTVAVFVAAYDKYVNIWKFTTGRDLSFNPLPLHEKLAAGSALLHGLVPYPETAMTWLVKHFNQEVIKDFLRKVAAEE